MAEPAPGYISNYVSKHNDAVLATAFSRDGLYLATGSADMSLKLMDVARMKRVHTTGHREFGRNPSSHPVVQTFYDHASAVLDLAFHPFQPILVSGSGDCSIKLFKTTTGVNRAFSVMQDAHAVNSLAFHPSGDFLLAGTADAALRVYDMETHSCFISADTDNFHTSGINSVAYDNSANLYVTGSSDGSIKVWDGANATVVNTIAGGHSGAPVTSVQLSSNGRYLLSSGLDSTVRLWEVSTAKSVQVYNQHVATMPSPATFNFHEKHILVSDEARGGIAIYDVHTAQIVSTLPGHKQPVSSITASPTEDAFASGSLDNFARYWSA